MHHITSHHRNACITFITLIFNFLNSPPVQNQKIIKKHGIIYYLRKLKEKWQIMSGTEIG